MAVAPVGTPQQGGVTSLSASVTVTLATGVGAGDLDLFSVTVQGSGLATATPSGWSQVAAVTDGTGAQMSTYARIRQAGDPATVTVSMTGGTSQAGWAAAAYTGVNQTTPYGTPTTLDDTVNDTTVPTPALTTIYAGSYRVITAGIGGSPTYTAMPSGYTEVIQCTSGKRTVIAHAANGSAGTTAASSFTLSANARGVSEHFEIIPAGASNSLPTANAGADQTVTTGSTVTVGGTDSDVDGTIASIAWTQIGGTTVTLSSTTAASPTFTAPGSPTTIVLRKTVTDNDGGTGTDDVTITVESPVEGVFPTGTPRAGQNTSAVSSGTVTLATGATGTNVYDVIGVTTQGTGIASATPAGWTLIGDVTDGSGVNVRAYGRKRTGSGDPTTVAVTVTGGTSQIGWVAAAYKGVHGTTPFGTATTDTTTVVGSTIDVPALNIVKANAYRAVIAGIGTGSATWTSPPTGTTQRVANTGGKNTVLADAAEATPTTIAASSFTISGATARGAALHVEIRPASLTNETPTADAGPDQTVEPWATVTLDGTGSADPDGSVATYAWTQTAGTTVTLSDAADPSPTFEAPASQAGETLTFGLTVTDNTGASSTQDTVDVTVLGATEFYLVDGTWVPLQTIAL